MVSPRPTWTLATLATYLLPFLWRGLHSSEFRDPHRPAVTDRDNPHEITLAAKHPGPQSVVRTPAARRIVLRFASSTCISLWPGGNLVQQTCPVLDIPVKKWRKKKKGVGRVTFLDEFI